MPAPVMDFDGIVRVGNSNVDCTGNSDATAALQACFDVVANSLFGGTVLFPAGAIVRLNGPVHYTANKPITVRGAGGRRGAHIVQFGAVAFNFAVAGLARPGDSQMYVTLDSLQLTTHAPASIAFQILDPEGITATDIRGSSGAGYWAPFWNLRNIRTSDFARMYLRNDHGKGEAVYEDGTDVYPLTEQRDDIKGVCFLFNGGALANTDNRFRDLTIQGFDTFLSATSAAKPGYEGFAFSNCSVVGCFTGIVWSNGANGAVYKPPLFDFHDGHMNCFRQWVSATNVAQFQMHHCTLEMSAKLDPVTDFGNYSPMAFDRVDGINVDNLFALSGRANSPIVVFPGCDKVHINNIGGFAQPGAPAMVQVLGGSKNGHISNVGGYNVGTPVLNGSTSILVTNSGAVWS